MKTKLPRAAKKAKPARKPGGPEAAISETGCMGMEVQLHRQVSSWSAGQLRRHAEKLESWARQLHHRADMMTMRGRRCAVGPGTGDGGAARKIRA